MRLKKEIKTLPLQHNGHNHKNLSFINSLYDVVNKYIGLPTIIRPTKQPTLE